jgi:lipopolysaccharide assembly protein A
MRYVYIALLAAATIVFLIFSFQNFQPTSVSLFQVRITLPLAVLMVLVYGLGMLTGGYVVALLRAWVRRAGEHPPHA